MLMRGEAVGQHRHRAPKSPTRTRKHGTYHSSQYLATANTNTARTTTPPECSTTNFLSRGPEPRISINPSNQQLHTAGNLRVVFRPKISVASWRERPSRERATAEVRTDHVTATSRSISARDTREDRPEYGRLPYLLYLISSVASASIRRER